MPPPRSGGPPPQNTRAGLPQSWVAAVIPASFVATSALSGRWGEWVLEATPIAHAMPIAHTLAPSGQWNGDLPTAALDGQPLIEVRLRPRWRRLGRRRR